MCVLLDLFFSDFQCCVYTLTNSQLLSPVAHMQAYTCHCYFSDIWQPLYLFDPSKCYWSAEFIVVSDLTTAASQKHANPVGPCRSG